MKILEKIQKQPQSLCPCDESLVGNPHYPQVLAAWFLLEVPKIQTQTRKAKLVEMVNSDLNIKLFIFQSKK